MPNLSMPDLLVTVVECPDGDLKLVVRAKQLLDLGRVLLRFDEVSRRNMGDYDATPVEHRVGALTREERAAGFRYSDEWTFSPLVREPQAYRSDDHQDETWVVAPQSMTEQEIRERFRQDVEPGARLLQRLPLEGGATGWVFRRSFATAA
ncbi:hypothetical protein [Nocardioides sp. GY 10127]|uniref:hypothetical protein n=1 Tax=Nocardioides sp. GY 10127 TaxID=2569762 RepID=UPI0010A7530D|nr:hypothetical protein [Nocardioides sp. GY 10127]TIC80700.1 hypothetical protein E8D37_12470 [Nocardioides sp. GY 10127]